MSRDLPRLLFAVVIVGILLFWLFDLKEADDSPLRIPG